MLEKITPFSINKDSPLATESRWTKVDATDDS
jgi:hypothetical protein